MRKKYYYLELCSGAFKVTAMQLLQCYSSYSSSSSSPEDECLSEKEFRSVYLVTYGLCGTAKFPTCLVFARAMVESFSTSTAKVVQWVCCREKHRWRRRPLSFEHQIKLDRHHCWMMSKLFLQCICGNIVHYSSRCHNYYTAWLYVTRSRWAGDCNSHTKPMSRHFYRLIYF